MVKTNDSPLSQTLHDVLQAVYTSLSDTEGWVSLDLFSSQIQDQQDEAELSSFCYFGDLLFCWPQLCLLLHLYVQLQVKEENVDEDCKLLLEKSNVPKMEYWSCKYKYKCPFKNKLSS